MGFDVKQVCMNGHFITDLARIKPESAQKYCGNCGEATITSCQNCATEIRGRDLSPGHINIGGVVPAYCHNCGKPYPWTQSRLKAAHDLVEEMSDLSAEEKELLAHSIDDIVQDGPRTELAVIRFKRLLSKVGKPSADAFKNILYGVVAGGVARAIWGG